MQYIDDSLAKQERCLQWGSQAGAWEPEIKVFGGTGILPVRRPGWKPVPLMQLRTIGGRDSRPPILFMFYGFPKGP